LKEKHLQESQNASKKGFKTDAQKRAVGYGQKNELFTKVELEEAKKKKGFLGHCF
jgi:heme-degrading monooxygenase HmoA